MRVCALILVVLSAISAEAQSLGEVARKEAERRKTVKTSGKTYTNDQLKSDGRDAASPLPPPAATTPAPGAAGAPAAGSGTAKTGDDKKDAKAGDARKDGAAVPAKDAPKDEAYWRARLQAEREALSRAQIFSEALQSRINGLSTDFSARDDPAQRAAVAADRQKSLDELARVKKEIQDHTKALSDIQDEARRAGVPAGWVR